MKPLDYQRAAMKTRCPQDQALTRIGKTPAPINDGNAGAQILHSVLGLTGEVGELASAIEKYAYYNQQFDVTNVQEEIGDVLWYIAELCSALNMDMGYIMESNIRKLKQRYPDKFEETLAVEENRDREAEMTRMDGENMMETKFPEEELYDKMSADAEKRLRAEDDGVAYEDA